MKKRKSIHSSKKNEAKHNPLKRVGSLKNALLAVGIFSLGLLGFYQQSKIEEKSEMPVGIERKVNGRITLEDARRDKSLRQEYLNQIIGTNSIPYCDGVVYDDDGRKLKKYTTQITGGIVSEEITGSLDGKIEDKYDSKTPDLIERSGIDEKAKIFIGAKMFENPNYKHLTEEDIKEGIIAHEGQHVMQHAKGINYLQREEILEGIKKGDLNSNLLYGVMEIDANAHELQRIFNGEFNVSSNQLYNLKRVFMAGNNALIRAQASGRITPLENKLIENLQSQIFKMPELRDISLDGTNGVKPEWLYKIK